MEKLNYFKRLYDECEELSEPRRTLQLSNLMDLMKAEYQISMFNYQSFANENVEVFALYQKVNKARDL